MRRKLRNRVRIITLILVGAASIALHSPAASPAATEAPVKEIVASHIGWRVNKTAEQKGATKTEQKICTVESKDQCQFAAQSNEPGGFLFAEGVAVNNATSLVSPEHGDVYVSDFGNQRVQVISPNGTFESMFGWDVNKTKKEKGASQAERNICTAVSKDTCEAGAQGAASGQFAFPASLAVDPATGNVYVEDFLNWRVQEFTATGEFVLMFGKKVDQTTGANVCTLASGDTCKAGERAVEGSTEAGAFDFAQNRAELLTIGGPEGLLYVGDRHRVQIFKTDGTAVPEVSLTSISAEPASETQALAVDQTGDIYVAYKVGARENIVYEMGANGNEIKRLEIAPRRPQATSVEVAISAVAFDSTGRLVVTERENGFAEGADFTALRGVLYEVGATSLHLLTEFNNEFQTGSGAVTGASSVTLNSEDDMYVVGEDELISYMPVPVGELTAKPAVCKIGADVQTDATFECDLNGEVNPWGVSETEVWFQWDNTSRLGFQTGLQPVETVEMPLQASSKITGLLPNETYHYRLAGEDENVKAPELLASEKASFTTPVVLPKIVSEPTVLDAGPFSVVVAGELNPENASTTYEFQYWPCEGPGHCQTCEELGSCQDILATAPEESSAYGVIPTIVEARGLSPDTFYRFRLLAMNESGEVKSEPFGEFTTSPAPTVTAQTGSASVTGVTSAVISGTVNPDGQAATYTFELGRYNSSNTQFGIVLSATTGSGAVPIEESLKLSGLQPGTTYAYRIAIHSGDGTVRGESATGATFIFTTAGLPRVFGPTAPPQLPSPLIAFPKAGGGKVPIRNSKKLANALKACKRKPRMQRANCERRARKKYPTTTKRK